MSCDFCGTLLPERLLVCPCGRLAYGKRLAARAREAEALEQRGELEAARSAWQETLAFLPEDAMQASEIRARIAKLEGEHARAAASRGELGRAAGVAGGLGALLLGLKAKVAWLLVLAKSSKVLLTGLTMLASIWAYTRILRLPFAVLLVVLIWVHEMGHVILLSWYGYRASAPIFIPFMGALVRLKQQPRNALEDAICGLGGPALGSLGAAVVLVAGRLLGSDLLVVGGIFSLLMNLFNLIPVYPLDGGRAAQVLTPRLWGIALALALGLAWVYSEPLIVIACLLPLGRVLAAARTVERGGRDADFHRIAPAARLAAFAAYIVLTTALVVVVAHFQPELHEFLAKHGEEIAPLSSASE